MSAKDTEEPSPTNRQQNSNKKLWHFFDQRMASVQVFMASLENIGREKLSLKTKILFQFYSCKYLSFKASKLIFFSIKFHLVA